MWRPASTPPKTALSHLSVLAQLTDRDRPKSGKAGEHARRTRQLARRAMRLHDALARLGVDLGVHHFTVQHGRDDPYNRLRITFDNTEPRPLLVVKAVFD